MQSPVIRSVVTEYCNIIIKGLKLKSQIQCSVPSVSYSVESPILFISASTTISVTAFLDVPRTSEIRGAHRKSEQSPTICSDSNIIIKMRSSMRYIEIRSVSRLETLILLKVQLFQAVPLLECQI